MVEGARGLADGAQWLSVVDYSIIAWGYVKVGGVYIEIRIGNIIRFPLLCSYNSSHLFKQKNVLFSVFFWFGISISFLNDEHFFSFSRVLQCGITHRTTAPGGPASST